MKLRWIILDRAASGGCVARLVRFFSFSSVVFGEFVNRRLKSDNIAYLHGLADKFRRRKLRRDSEAALAKKLDTKAAWKSIACAFGELPMAGGAMWGSDTVGYWTLYKPKGTEVKPCIIELLNHFHIPIGADTADCVYCGVAFRNLETLGKFGVPLDMESLQTCAHCIHKERETDTHLRAVHGKENSKSGETKANINNTGHRINSVNPTLYKGGDHDGLNSLANSIY